MRRDAFDQLIHDMGADSFEQLLARPTDELLRSMDWSQVHQGDAVLTIMVLKAVAELRAVTVATDARTSDLLRAARFTLAVAAVTLVVAIVALVKG